MISIVVPALDEEAEIAACLRSARAPEVGEVIVVDGGSRDATCAIAGPLADRVLHAAPGRARQMNLGAQAASGAVLLFLHADTRLPAGFGGAVEAAIARGAVGGRFDVVLRGSHPGLRVVAALMNARSRLSRIATGDQAIFVRRDAFEALGGFAALPLMEDIDFSRRLKRAGATAALRLRVNTAGRRWEEHGLARTVLLMWWLRWSFWRGVPAETLAKLYRRHRSGKAAQSAG